MDAARFTLLYRYADEIAARGESARRLVRALRECRRKLSEAEDELLHLAALIDSAPDLEQLEECNVPASLLLVAGMFGSAKAAVPQMLIAANFASEQLCTPSVRTGEVRSSDRRWSPTYFVRTAFEEASDEQRQVLGSIPAPVWRAVAEATGVASSDRTERKSQAAAWATRIRRERMRRRLS